MKSDSSRHDVGTTTETETRTERKTEYRPESTTVSTIVSKIETKSESEIDYTHGADSLAVHAPATAENSKPRADAPPAADGRCDAGDATPNGKVDPWIR